MEKGLVLMRTDKENRGFSLTEPFWGTVVGRPFLDKGLAHVPVIRRTPDFPMPGDLVTIKRTGQWRDIAIGFQVQTSWTERGVEKQLECDRQGTVARVLYGTK